MGHPENRGRHALIDMATQSRLGRRLRAVYRDVTREPVPLEQIELLLALRRAERERRYSGPVRPASTCRAGFLGKCPDSGAKPPDVCT